MLSQVFRLPVLAPAIFVCAASGVEANEVERQAAPAFFDMVAPEGCDPSADFALLPAQANAAPLDIVNTMTVAMLSNRLDIGSPPFIREPAHAVRRR